jgi:hypothetical protein
VAEDRGIAQALAGVHDADSAFEFIEWFAREWQTPLRDGDGCTAEQVAIVEKRLGFRLPSSVTTFYRLLGWRIDLTRNQDTLIFLQSLRVVDGALVYRIENQACVSWGIRVADLGLEDPPVVFCEGYGDGKPWRPFLGSFSLAAVEMVLSESLVGRAGLLANLPVDDDAHIARLEAACEPLPFPDYPAWWQPDVPQAARWFTRPGVLIREDSRSWLWVLARDSASLDRLRQAIPGDWQNTTTGLALQ